MKHKLMISIEEDVQQTEEDLQFKAIGEEIKRFKCQLLPSFANISSLRSFDQRELLKEKNNSYLNQLLVYMESDNYRHDSSYQMLSQIEEIGFISKSIFLSRKSCEQVLQCDFSSEWKLIKMITEDNKHKSNLLEISKALKRNNRYSDIAPYKYNFAPYQGCESYLKENQNDWYVNASYVDGPFQEDERAFIATQGPMNNSISKFWKLCFNKEVKLVLMLCSFEEEGRRKCDYYLPSLNQSLFYSEDNMFISLDKEEWVLSDCLIKRELTIIINGRSKKVYHLQMINWPDYSAPIKNGHQSIDYIIKAIAEFRQLFPFSPVLTHCSAGTGRTGTLLAIFNLIKCLSFFKSVNEREVQPFLSVFNMVRKLREQRVGMVSSLEQYKYIYSYLIEWSLLNLDLK